MVTVTKEGSFVDDEGTNIVSLGNGNFRFCSEAMDFEPDEWPDGEERTVDIMCFAHEISFVGSQEEYDSQDNSLTDEHSLSDGTPNNCMGFHVKAIYDNTMREDGEEYFLFYGDCLGLTLEVVLPFALDGMKPREKIKVGDIVQGLFYVETRLK